MNRAIGIFLTLLLFAASGFSQIVNPSFAKYLKNKGNYEDLILLDQMGKEHLTQLEIDSLNYYIGWAHYSLQNIEKGINKFASVSEKSALYNASGFFASWSELYLKNPDQASYHIANIDASIKLEKELLSIFRTGITLMNRELPLADSLVKISMMDGPVYLPQWERMQVHHDRLQSYKPKSYFVAGSLSAIIPGAGKVYSGQKGAGISSFLSLGAMAAITIENMIKTGWNSWNSLLSAGTFGIFYFGNIYGSIVGIKVYRERFNNEVDRAVLLDINIPLRNIYK